MLLFVAASVLFYVMGLLGTVWSLAIGWFLVLVAGHVFANVWGSSVLRTKTLGSETGESTANGDLALERVIRSLHTESPLHDSIPHSRVEFLAAILGALCGAVLGAVLLASHYWQTAGFTALGLGTVSFGVIGGFVGFLLSSFLRVAVRAMREARVEANMASDSRPQPLTPTRCG